MLELEYLTYDETERMSLFSLGKRISEGVLLLSTDADVEKCRRDEPES